jgi:DNA-directed RNA polymerase specialized sigma24 family protein
VTTLAEAGTRAAVIASPRVVRRAQTAHSPVSGEMKYWPATRGVSRFVITVDEGPRGGLRAWTGAWPACNSADETRLVAEMLALASHVAARLAAPSVWADAADAASIAVCAVVEKLRAGASIDNLAGYLVVAVRHAVLDDDRKNRRLREALVGDVDDACLPVPSAEPEVACDEVVVWFSRLRRSRPRMQEGEVVLTALRLIDEGYSQDEVARQLGLTRTNLSHKLAAYSRAMRDLRATEGDGDGA